MKRLLHAGLCCSVLAFAGLAQADERPQPETVEMFAAMESGELEVKYIAKNDHEARVIIKNNTQRPLNVKLPQAFAGVPVLAQGMFGGGGGGGMMGGGGGQSQGMGGGMGGGGMGGGGMGGGGGGGFFNVPPQAAKGMDVAHLCLDHGKKDPTSIMPYKIVPIDQYASDPEVQELVTMFGTGRLNHAAAQAAAWHLRNGLSWQELAAKTVRRANGATYPYFSRQELMAGYQYAAVASHRAKLRPPAESPGEKSVALGAE